MKVLSTQRGGVEAALLPAALLPLLNEAFVQSCNLVERYTVALAAQVFETSALDRSLNPARISRINPRRSRSAESLR